MKILNLYAGIGGNRKLWPIKDTDEVVAVEIEPKIAEIYQRFFPKDNVVIADAHQYLLEHYKEFDFIWSSPPCPTHSVMRNLKNNCDEAEKKYPDMNLYQEILFLKHFFKGLWVVENVISYYEPLIKPQESNNHYFWCNFHILNMKPEIRGIRSEKIAYKEKLNGVSLPKDLPLRFQEKVLNNMVKPELALMIWNCAFKEKQLTIELSKGVDEKCV